MSAGKQGDLTGYREATAQEVEGYLQGHLLIPGAIETEHGLLVPSERTPTPCPTSPSRLHVFHRKRLDGTQPKMLGCVYTAASDRT
jgi:hypothetical protein